jgi:hypothetical protein
MPLIQASRLIDHGTLISFYHYYYYYYYCYSYYYSKMAGLTTDNVSNNKKTFQQYWWLSCFGHNLHLAARKGFELKQV